MTLIIFTVRRLGNHLEESGDGVDMQNEKWASGRRYPFSSQRDRLADERRSILRGFGSGVLDVNLFWRVFPICR